MRNLVVVAFLDPVVQGLEFDRKEWPLHITLARFDVPGNDAGPAGSPVREPAQADPLADRIAVLMAGPASAALGNRLIAGAEAGFGRSGLIPVSLVEPSGPLQELHEALVRIVAELPGRIATPGYTLAGFRPHVSHRGGNRLREGDEFVLNRIALVDMAPDGSHATRRILKLWTAPGG
ncbi:hypothetical protein VUN84_00490 [Micrococcaceae bacterium Sec5.8]